MRRSTVLPWERYLCAETLMPPGDTFSSLQAAADSTAQDTSEILTGRAAPTYSPQDLLQYSGEDRHLGKQTSASHLETAQVHHLPGNPQETAILPSTGGCLN